MQPEANSSCALKLNVLVNEPTFSSMSIIVPASLVDALYRQAVTSQKGTPAFGFHKRETPFAYIEQNYQSNLYEHIQEFLLKYLVIGFLEQEIYKKKILMAGRPRLTSLDIQPGQDAVFNFELSLFPALAFHEWKYLPFKAPKRKNYKDLDRQVESFLHEEIAAKEHYVDSSIKIGDWVNYSVRLLNNDSNPVFNGHVANLWVKIGDEEPDKPIQEVFINKKNGQQFVSSNRILQDYFTESLNTNYSFGISINEVVPYSYFCLEQFKHYFRIKSNKEMYQKAH